MHPASSRTSSRFNTARPASSQRGSGGFATPTRAPDLAPQNFRHEGSPAGAADGSRAGPPEAVVSEGETRHAAAECRHHPGQGTAIHGAAGVGPAEATSRSTSSDRASLPFIAAVAGTAAFGIVDWSVALLVGGGHLIARQRGQQQERLMSTADVGESVLLVEPTDPLAPDPDAVRQPVGALVGKEHRTANSNAALVTTAERVEALRALSPHPRRCAPPRLYAGAGPARRPVRPPCARQPQPRLRRRAGG